MLQRKAVSTIHVVPVLDNVYVCRTVNLNHQPRLFPHDVKPSPSSLPVAPRHLAVGLWQVKLAYHEPGEIEFGQRMGAAFDVGQSRPQYLTPPHALVAVNFGNEIGDTHQSLLYSGRQHGLCAAIRSHPRGCVHQ